MRLYYLRARFYMPSIGRFLTADKVVRQWIYNRNSSKGLAHGSFVASTDLRDPLWGGAWPAFCMAVRAAIVIYHVQRIITGGTGTYHAYAQAVHLLAPMCFLSNYPLDFALSLIPPLR